MKILVDTNIFIALIENSPGAKVANRLLNVRHHEIGTGTLNLLEIRTVLTKKKSKSQRKVEAFISWLRRNLDFIVDQIPPLSDVETRHKRTLLYPMDCLIMQTSDDAQAVPTTLDREMRDWGGVHPRYLV